MHTVFEVCVCARMCVCIVLCCIVLYGNGIGVCIGLVFVLYWFGICIVLDCIVLYCTALHCTALYVWMYVCMYGWMDGWMQYQQVLPRDPRFFSLDLFWWV
jgi:hypothetical protein